jgi:hypothetical protein
MNLTKFVYSSFDTNRHFRYFNISMSLCFVVNNSISVHQEFLETGLDKRSMCFNQYHVVNFSNTSTSKSNFDIDLVNHALLSRATS